MSDALRLILEDTDGTQLETSCTRFCVVWQGKEVWIQHDGRGQLLIGVDVEEGDAEYANLLLRPWRPTWSACSWKWNRPMRAPKKRTVTFTVRTATTKTPSFRDAAPCSLLANCST